MALPILTAAIAATELQPAPITPHWILGGTPQASNKLLGFSEDRASYIVVWECTPGQFKWHYTEDETVVIIAGETYLTMQDGQERRLSAGDVAFFPAGSTCTWRITNKVRKLAVLRNTLPLPLSITLRAWNKILKVLGLKGQPAL